MSAAVPLSPARSLSRSLPACAILSAPIFFTRALPLSLSRGPGSPVAEPLPRAPLSSLSASWACPVSSIPSALAVDRRVRTRARRRISRPRRSPTRPAPFLEPSQCPAPHFAQLHSLSSSAHASSRRRRPTPMFPTIQAAGDRARPPQALPRGETLSHPVLESKPNANHVRARISNSRTQQLHNWTSSHSAQIIT
jgi:hypothetical protein